LLPQLVGSDCLRQCGFVPKPPGGSMTLPYNGFTKLLDKLKFGGYAIQISDNREE
jgi:hypothetical protein